MQQVHSVDQRMKLMSAIAIVLVVAHHIPDAPGFSGPFDLFWPYDFHVSVFVFVAGYFYKSSCEQRPLAFVAQKAYRLILPLYLIGLVYGILTAWLHTQGFVFGDELSLANVLVAPFVSGHQWSINSSMWFLSALFGTHVFNLCMRLLLRSVPDGAAKEVALFMFYLLVGSAAIVVGGAEGVEPRWDAFQLPVLRSLFFLAPFGMGRLYRTVLEAHDVVPSAWYFIILFTVQVGLAAISQDNARHLVAWCKFPVVDNCGPLLAVPVTYGVVACGIAYLLRISRILGNRLGSVKVVRAIADNTMSIMNHHLFAFFLLSGVYYAIGQTTGLFSAFDVEAWHANPGYVFAPLELTQAKVFYLIAGIAVPLGMHAVWMRAKEAGLRLVHAGIRS